jgi:glycosyltransferase involved in cell wall biosynthesis
MKISFVVAGYPPDLDGIGDYTHCLARAMAERSDVSIPVNIYTRTGSHVDEEHLLIHPFFDFSQQASFRALLPLLDEEASDWLVLQYNPFCWGKRGWCPDVPSTLRKIKALPRSPKIAVMFHETTVPKWPWRYAVMYAWQRPILRLVAKQADQIFVSTKRWIGELASAGAVAPMSLLPVGSNIPRSLLPKAEARSRLGFSDDLFVVGVFGGAHPSRLLDWISMAAKAIARAYPKVILLHVGPEGEVINRAIQDLPFKTLGVQAACKAADAIRALDIVIAPFVDGVSTRRGSVMAAFNNGIPVATTRRESTDDWFLTAEPEVVLVSAAKNKEDFAREVLAWAKPLDNHVTAITHSFHDAFFSWTSIASQLTSDLASHG